MRMVASVWLFAVFSCSICPITSFLVPQLSSPSHLKFKMVSVPKRPTFVLNSSPVLSPFLTNSLRFPTTSHGSLVIHTSSNHPTVSAGDTLTVYYTPPDSYFSPSEHTLTFVGGFNGYDGSEPAMQVPVSPCFHQDDLQHGAYKLHITVPNFARSIEFVITDGVRYDNGPDGWFRVHVENILVEGEGGEVKRMRHDPISKSLELVEVIPNVDPLELEKELRAHQETMYDVEVNEDDLPDTILVKEGSEESIRGFLAEADVVGKSLGMGNMEIGECRNAFDNRDVDGLVPFTELPALLGDLGFFLPPDEVTGLISIYVPDLSSECVRMSEFVRMYHHLDERDAGIDMV